MRYTGGGYPAVDAFGAVTNPAAVITDSLLDTPTNYTADSGNNGGNYATLNALDTIVSLTNGSLETNNSSGWQSTRATFGMSSGKCTGKLRASRLLLQFLAFLEPVPQ